MGDVAAAFLVKDENCSGSVTVTDVLDIMTDLELTDQESLRVLKKAAEGRTEVEFAGAEKRGGGGGAGTKRCGGPYSLDHCGPEENEKGIECRVDVERHCCGRGEELIVVGTSDRRRGRRWGLYQSRKNLHNMTRILIIGPQTGQGLIISAPPYVLPKIPYMRWLRDMPRRKKRSSSADAVDRDGDRDAADRETGAQTLKSFDVDAGEPGEPLEDLVLAPSETVTKEFTDDEKDGEGEQGEEEVKEGDGEGEEEGDEEVKEGEEEVRKEGEKELKEGDDEGDGGGAEDRTADLEEREDEARPEGRADPADDGAAADPAPPAFEGEHKTPPDGAPEEPAPQESAPDGAPPSKTDSRTPSKPIDGAPPSNPPSGGGPSGASSPTASRSALDTFRKAGNFAVIASRFSSKGFSNEGAGDDELANSPSRRNSLILPEPKSPTKDAAAGPDARSFFRRGAEVEHAIKNKLIIDERGERRRCFRYFEKIEIVENIRLWQKPLCGKPSQDFM